MKTLISDGQKVNCPVCDLVHDILAPLEVKGKSGQPIRDKKLECPSCHRAWESVRYFFDYWCVNWLPQIEKEMAERDIVPETKEQLEAHGEWKWKRERQVREAIEEGKWHPMKSMHHLPPLRS